MNVSKEAREACAAYASPSTYQPGDGDKYGESLPLCQAFAKFEAEITQRVRDEALEEAARVAAGPYVSRSLYDERSPFFGSDLNPDRSELGRGQQIGREAAAAAIRQMIGGKA